MENFENTGYSTSADTLRVAALGGGSTGNTGKGLIQAIQELSPSTKLEVTAYVTTGDDGGASGDLTEITGQVAVGDVRRTISAVSADENAAIDFEHRFNADSSVSDVRSSAEQLYATLTYNPGYDFSAERAGRIIDMTVDLSQSIVEKRAEKLDGVALGHLILTAMAIENDIDSATEEAGRLMLAQARVIPLVTEQHKVRLRDGDEIIVGEHKLDDGYRLQNPDNFDISLCYDEAGKQTDVRANPTAVAELAKADTILIGPGSVLTSTLQALGSTEIREAVRQASIDPNREVFLLGNIKQTDETEGWTVQKFADAHSMAIGATIDAVIGNTDTLGVDNPVVFDEQRLLENGDEYEVIPRPIRKQEAPTYTKGDKLAAEGKRSDVEHDMYAVVNGMLEYHTKQLAKRTVELAA